MTNGLIGKDVKLFWDDFGKVVVKIGVIVAESSNFIEIKTERGIEAIPMIKVVRIEVIR